MTKVKSLVDGIGNETITEKYFEKFFELKSLKLLLLEYNGV